MDLLERRWTGAAIRRVRDRVAHLCDAREMSWLLASVALDVMPAVRRMVAARGLVRRDRMSKRNWVCFGCRTAVRREEPPSRPVMCANCGEPRVNLGYKIPIPEKSNVKGWQALREQYFGGERAAEQQQREAQQRQRHTLEREIARLESGPPNESRATAVKLLKKQLERLA
jgi:hypothetical protein